MHDHQHVRRRGLPPAFSAAGTSGTSGATGAAGVAGNAGAADAAGAEADAALSFKRFILEKTAAFEHEPAADLFRVNLLGRMLDRYDELRRTGASVELCVQRACREFADIPGMMERAGFARVDSDAPGANGWPQMSDAEAARYLAEYRDYAVKRSLGTGMTAACCAPMMGMAAFSELFAYSSGLEEGLMMLGVAGMFGMIAAGVYMMATAKKPKRYAEVKAGRFSLSRRLRGKLEALREQARDGVRKRRAKGIALCVGCVVPIFMGAALDGIFSIWSDFCTIMGVGGMFMMIGAGVYELVAAKGEKDGLERLLK